MIDQEQGEIVISTRNFNRLQIEEESKRPATKVFDINRQTKKAQVRQDIAVFSSNFQKS